MRQRDDGEVCGGVGWWSCGQPVKKQPCDAAVQGGEEGGGGGVSLLPSPEGTAASGTSPESSDGARSPQTSENKHTLLVLISNSSNIIKLSKHIQCISFHNITLMFAFLRDEGYFLSSFSLIRFHNTILCVLHV